MCENQVQRGTLHSHQKTSCPMRPELCVHCGKDVPFQQMQVYTVYTCMSYAIYSCVCVCMHVPVFLWVYTHRNPAFIFSVVQYYIASILQVYSYSRCFAVVVRCTCKYFTSSAFDHGNHLGMHAHTGSLERCRCV